MAATHKFESVRGVYPRPVLETQAEKMSDEKKPAGSEPTGSRTAPAADFNPAVYCVQETLRDGGAILIRAIRPDDKDLLREHGRGLSTESVYHRFMAYKRDLCDRDLQRFTELEFNQHVGMVAIISEDGLEHIIGVGRYVRTSNGRAEVALSVIDRHQGRGIGTLLLKHLSRIAKHSGITEFEADVMADNVHMLDVVAASGFKLQKTHDSGLVHLLLRIDHAERD
jgi:GNAT superfamily N-acetyltransferase